MNKLSSTRTESRGLVMAQVITVETKMNIFRDLKLPISAWRAERKGVGGRQLLFSDTQLSGTYSNTVGNPFSYLWLPMLLPQSALWSDFLRCCTPQHHTAAEAEAAHLYWVTLKRLTGQCNLQFFMSCDVIIEDYQHFEIITMTRITSCIFKLSVEP